MHALAENISCENITVKTSSGNIKLKNLLASEAIKLEANTGDVTLTDCDASIIEIETDTGDVTCTLLSGKIYTPDSDTGRINVPDHDRNGGICDIKTDTGDIKVVVRSK